MNEGIACAGGCGDHRMKPSECGWDYLPISGRWRCPDCTKELQRMGVPKEEEDSTGAKLE